MLESEQRSYNRKVMSFEIWTHLLRHEDQICIVRCHGNAIQRRAEQPVADNVRLPRMNPVSETVVGVAISKHQNEN